MTMQRRTVESYLEISKEYWKLQTGYHKAYEIGAGGPSIALDPAMRFHYDRLTSNLTYHNPKFTDNWDVTAQLSYMYTEQGNRDQTIYPPGAFDGAYPNGLIYNTSLHETHNRLNLSAFYSGLENHLVRLGTGHNFGEINEMTHSDNSSSGTSFIDYTDTDAVVQPEGRRDSWHVFIQDIWSFASNWELTLGLRYDKYSDLAQHLIHAVL